MPAFRRALLIALIVVGVVVDGFFALINFYPVAPTRSRGPRRYVLVSLDETQAKWLQRNVIDEFDAEQNTDLEVRAVPEEQLLAALGDAKQKRDVVLASLPRAFGDEAIKRGLVRPFTDVASSGQLAGDFGDLRADVMRAAQFDGKPYFVPNRTNVDVSIYRASKVRDVVLHWTLLRAQLDAALRAVNGRGLPADYALEASPSEWDSYDVFVAGFYWAHRVYEGHPARGRIAHRTGASLGAQLDVLAGVYRAGATDETIARADSPESVAYFQWEALYREQGIFAQEMLRPEGLDDDALVDTLARADVFFSDVDQMDAFRLHGSSHREAPPLVIDDPDDLDFAPLPRVASLSLDPAGRPARVAPSFAFREDWEWALPASEGDKLGYQLLQWLWTRETHVRTCEALGTLPLRNDVEQERDAIFRLDWMTDVFDAGFSQWSRAQPPPTDLLVDGGGVRYAAWWASIVRDGGASSASPTAIAAALRTTPKAPAPPSASSAVASHVEPQTIGALAPKSTLFDPVVISGVDGGVDGSVNGGPR